MDKFKPLIFDFVKFYREELCNVNGGSLHIALDDGNLTDHDLFLCQEEAQKSGDSFGYFLSTLLRHFTEVEREEMYKNSFLSKK